MSQVNLVVIDNVKEQVKVFAGRQCVEALHWNPAKPLEAAEIESLRQNPTEFMDALEASA